MRIATIDIHVPFVENLTVTAPSLHLESLRWSFDLERQGHPSRLQPVHFDVGGLAFCSAIQLFEVEATRIGSQCALEGPP